MLLKQPQIKDLMRSKSNACALVPIIHPFRSFPLDKVHLKILLDVICSYVQKRIQQNAQIIPLDSKTRAKLHRKSYSAIQRDVGRNKLGFAQTAHLELLVTSTFTMVLPKSAAVKIHAPLQAAHLTPILPRNCFISVLSSILDSTLMIFVMTWVLFFYFACFVVAFFNLKTLYSTLTQANCSFSWRPVKGNPE